VVSLEGYGAGPGHADDILACQACLGTANADGQACLTAIHK
jgi:hypothetical protein